MKLTFKRVIATAAAATLATAAWTGITAGTAQAAPNESGSSYEEDGLLDLDLLDYDGHWDDDWDDDWHDWHHDNDDLIDIDIL